MKRRLTHLHIWKVATSLFFQVDLYVPRGGQNTLCLSLLKMSECDIDINLIRYDYARTRIDAF